MKIKAFITHKKAETFRDCQDRFSIDIENRSLAVSDGMSQSIFQTYWADILAHYYTESNWQITTEADDNLKRLSKKWNNRVHERLKELKSLGKNTFRAENNLALGMSACATLVGIRFKGQDWIGEVLGDSCLIEVSAGNINIETSQETEEFDNYPDYIDSNPDKKGKGKAKNISGTLIENTLLLLVSDPFSDFFAEKSKDENASDYIHQLLALDTHEQFEELVNKWRQDYGMHNDDSTLIIIEFDGKDTFNIANEDDINELIEKEDASIHVQKENSIIKNSQSVPDLKVSEDDFLLFAKAEVDKKLASYNHGKLNKIFKSLDKNKVYKAFGQVITSLYNKYNILTKD